MRKGGLPSHLCEEREYIKEKAEKNCGRPLTFTKSGATIVKRDAGHHKGIANKNKQSYPLSPCGESWQAFKFVTDVGHIYCLTLRDV